jgi:hypothetical protein
MGAELTPELNGYYCMLIPTMERAHKFGIHFQGQYDSKMLLNISQLRIILFQVADVNMLYEPESVRHGISLENRNQFCVLKDSV